MADTHEPGAHGHGDSHGHHGPNLIIYLSVAGALAVFTAVSFIVSAIGMAHNYVGLTIILGVAICKASLVTAFFMHVKYDWRNVYFIIIPIMILAVMMVIVLMPDGVIGWRHSP
jgi:cytochrome c oxidase subunit 4